MAKYECKICGYVFDEQQAGESFENLYSCPICDADRSGFKLIEEDEVKAEEEDGDDDFVFEEADEDIAKEETSNEEEAASEEAVESNINIEEEPYEEASGSENFSQDAAENNSTGSFADFLREKEKEKESELTSRNEFKDFIDEVLEENAESE